MIFKDFRHRFVFITVASISFVFILILVALNIFMTSINYHRGYAILAAYAQHDDNDIGNFLREDNFNNMRVFSALFDKDGIFLELYGNGCPELTEKEKLDMAEQVIISDKDQGYYAPYLYRISYAGEAILITFLNFSLERDMCRRLLYICIIIGLIGIIVITIPIIFLSQWVTHPIQLAFDKQRQFITDASHELKTPLTIITTNAEVLATSLPDNKWLSHILEQSGRMKLLINNMLNIARLDDSDRHKDFTVFDLSRTVQNAALSFESLAYEYHKSYQMHIERNLSLTGNESNIRELVTILLDNAFKYSDENGNIEISLLQQGSKKILTVSNTGKSIAPEDRKRIFERFYRSDTSRSRESGGYGLGLSIAHSIVVLHNGHISVECNENDCTVFTVVL